MRITTTYRKVGAFYISCSQQLNEKGTFPEKTSMRSSCHKLEVLLIARKMKDMLAEQLSGLISLSLFQSIDDLPMRLLDP
jgi:hypothetical protein